MNAPRMEIVYRMLELIRDPSIPNEDKIATIRQQTTAAEQVLISEVLAVEARDRLSSFHEHVGLASILMSMTLREITCVGAISGLLRPWFRVDVGDHMERELGAMVKVVPNEVAAEIEEWIKWGGLAG